jgi:hypothetical protein
MRLPETSWEVGRSCAFLGRQRMEPFTD